MANFYNPYQYNYYPPVQQMSQQQVPQQQMQQPQMPQPQQQQIQNGGFVSVRNEMEARNYPVAPGNSITFKDETAPYVYTKTMGFSQLDRPIFDKYKLVKEEVSETVSEAPVQQVLNPRYEEKLSSLQAEVNRLWGEINALKEQKSESKPVRQKPNKEDKNGGDD